MKLKNKLMYVSGDLGISIAFFSVGFFFLYYLTDFVGIKSYIAGIIMGTGMVWDAVTDPVMGYISDRTKTPYGKKRVYVLFGAIPLGAAFFLLWAVPLTGPGWMKITLALVFFLLFKTAYTMVAIPYMALLSAITKNYHERTQISAFRALTTQIGTILGGVCALLVYSFSTVTDGLRTLGLLFGFMVALLMILSAQSVIGMERQEEKPKKLDIKEIASETWAAMKERNYAILLVMYFFGGIATTALTASFPYFTTHVMNNEDLSTFGLAAFIIASACTVPVWLKLSKKFEKKRLLLVSTVSMGILLLITAFMVNEGDTVLFFVLVAAVGLFMSAYFIIPYSLVPDVVDLNELETGVRKDSTFYGLWVFIHKIGLALAPVIMGFVMANFGYDGTLESQTESGRMAIRITFGFLPGVFLIITGLVLQPYGITRAKFEEIKKELERKEALK